MSSSTSLLFVFSGGTACNAFAKEMQAHHHNVAYCMPVSDNGGSTSEIMRVLGGPAIGDIRSRLLRLAPRSSPQQRAIYKLLSHRLNEDDQTARIEWNSIVEGRHELWRGVSADHKQIIRSFMIHFHTAVLTAASEQPGPNGEAVKAFCFHRGSVGNFFFSGCRKFFNSLSAAITLWSSLVGIPHETAVLPIINSNHTVTIGAQLEDGSKIFGQNQISHPGDVVDKQHQGQQPLPARIRRLFYLNDWRQEIEFHADPSVLSTLSHAAMVVYSMGSLYTSICASLATKGVGDHIATLACPKVLILNGTVDRETHGMTAMDFVWAIVHACVGSSRHNANQRTAKQDDAALVSQFVTHVLYLTTSEVPMDGGRLEELGLRVIPISEHAASNPQHYRTRALVSAILDILPPDRGSS